MTKKMIIPAVILFIAAILIYSMGGSAVAYAAESNLEFDKTYVLDDLEASAVNGVTFDVDDYPYDKDGDIQLIGFVESVNKQTANFLSIKVKLAVDFKKIFDVYVITNKHQQELQELEVKEL